MAPPNCLLAVLALTVFLGTNNALPITSRPIEGNVQRMVWEDWVNLDSEQRNLTKEKKITAKSIFTLPFRHCPQGHTLFNQLCIPQSNINPVDLVKQELILAGSSNGNPPPPPIADYDYGDDEESDEIVYDPSVIPTAMQDGLLPSVGDGDQALPSEDAPLKFNIFEKKFPTGKVDSEELPLPADTVAATYAKNISTTAETLTSTAPTSTTAVAVPAMPSGEASNRTSDGDLIAAPTDAFFTSTTLTMASSNSTTTTTSNRDVGQVETIVLPADQAHDGSLHLVTSSLTDNDSDDFTTVNGLKAEADLAQLLKVDAFLPAYDGSIELLPPLFSHRKAAPSLSADQDVNTKQAVEAAEKIGTEMEEEEEKEGEVTGTEIVPSEEEEYTTETATTVAEASMDTSPASSTSVQSLAHPPKEHEIDERENRLVLIKSKVQPVQLTTTTSATATATTEADVADDSNSSTDRFHYQHFVEDVAASSTTTAMTTPEPSSSTAGEPIEQSDMPASYNDNLMTNTIGGRGDEDNAGGHKASSEIDVQQELRLINELVKGKQRKQHQKQQLDQTSTEATLVSTSTSSEDSTITTAIAYTNWSKVMPQSGQSTSESAATTETAATPSQVNESSSTASSAATEVKHLSISNRSNRNSKIIRVDRLAEQPEGTAASAATAESAATAATPPNSSSSNPNDYTPFWWLPSIGWRLDRQLDGKGEDQSLLLRFFSTFRGSNTAATTR